MNSHSEPTSIPSLPKLVRSLPLCLSSVPSNGASEASVYAEVEFYFINAARYSTILHNVLLSEFNYIKIAECTFL